MVHVEQPNGVDLEASKAALKSLKVADIEKTIQVSNERNYFPMTTLINFVKRRRKKEMIARSSQNPITTSPDIVTANSQIFL